MNTDPINEQAECVARIRAAERRTEGPLPQYNLSIHSNPDARAWAKFFVETYCDLCREGRNPLHPEADINEAEAWMATWFANAMMAMHDHLHTRALAPEPEQQAVAPGESWRMLEVGEVIQEGDEWQDIDNRWHSANDVIGTQVGAVEHRRRVTPAPTPTAEPRTDDYAERRWVVRQENNKLRADLSTALTERNQALAAQAELMQVIADIRDLATSSALPYVERLAAIAERTRTHHTPV